MGIIDQMTDELRKIVYKLLFKKNMGSDDEFVFEYNMEEEVLLTSLKRLIFEGKVNEAEDILFDKAKHNPSEHFKYIVLEFYSTLMKKSDEELEKIRFSREEIYEGIDDIREIMNLK